MLPVVTYFVARLVLFLVCAVVLRLLGAAPLLALVGGLVISMLLSYVLLRRLRDPATAAVAERVEARSRRRATRVDEDALVEDALRDDELREDLLRDDVLRGGARGDDAPRDDALRDDGLVADDRVDETERHRDRG